MTEKDCAVLEQFFTERKPKRVFGWGVGWFSTTAPGVKTWDIAEHDPANIASLYDAPIPPYVHIQHLEGAYANGYAVRRLVHRADVVIINGVERERCARTAAELMRPTSVVLFLDAASIVDHSWYHLFPYAQRLSRPAGPTGGVMAFARTPLGPHRS